MPMPYVKIKCNDGRADPEGPLRGISDAGVSVKENGKLRFIPMRFVDDVFEVDAPADAAGVAASPDEDGDD